jgi:hypothetical protein
MTKFSQNLCRKVKEVKEIRKNEFNSKNFGNPYIGFNQSMFSESANKFNKMIENTSGLTISGRSQANSDLLDDSSSVSSTASVEEHILAPLNCIGGKNVHLKIILISKTQKFK